MNDSLGAMLAIVVLWLILRFAFGGSSSSSGSANTASPSLDAARARQVPQHMVDAVRTLFPHVPEASIRYDLQRSRSAEATCDRILNEGGLPTPPAGFFSTTPPRPTVPGATTTNAAGATHTAGGAAAGGANQRTASGLTSSSSATRATLVSRFGLDKSEGAAPAAGTGEEGQQQGWATSPEERAKRLEERKKRMVMEARKKLMEKQETSSA